MFYEKYHERLKPSFRSWNVSLDIHGQENDSRNQLRLLENLPYLGPAAINIYPGLLLHRYSMRWKFVFILKKHKKICEKYPVIILFVCKFVYMYFCIDKLYLLFQSYLNQNQIRIRTNNNDMIFFPLNSDTNWLSSSAYSQVPVRAEIFGMKQQDGASPYQFHHIYDYTDFSTTLDPLTTVFEVLATTLWSFEFQNMSNAFDNLSLWRESRYIVK